MDNKSKLELRVGLRYWRHVKLDATTGCCIGANYAGHELTMYLTCTIV